MEQFVGLRLQFIWVALSAAKALAACEGAVMAEYYIHSMIAANNRVLWQNHGFSLRPKGKP
jgi:hypothetical protein